MPWLNMFLLACFAYLLGSCPTGYWIGRWVAKIDVRAVGSRNIGAANVARSLGRRWGILVLLLDTAKGALPVGIALHLLPPEVGISVLAAALVALAAFSGHLFSLFLRFQGGKGVATAFGISLVLLPKAALASLAVFLLVTWRWRYVSLGSLTAALSLPLWAALMGYHLLYMGLALLLAISIAIRHRLNIRDLAQGKERKW
jgi:glycerol-3-phosphate acyltransferase PlsY